MHFRACGREAHLQCAFVTTLYRLAQVDMPMPVFCGPRGRGTTRTGSLGKTAWSLAAQASRMRVHLSSSWRNSGRRFEMQR